MTERDLVIIKMAREMYIRRWQSSINLSGTDDKAKEESYDLRLARRMVEAAERFEHAVDEQVAAAKVADRR